MCYESTSHGDIPFACHRRSQLAPFWAYRMGRQPLAWGDGFHGRKGHLSPRWGLGNRRASHPRYDVQDVQGWLQRLRKLRDTSSASSAETIDQYGLHFKNNLSVGVVFLSLKRSNVDNTLVRY